jgi:hypothetical protein
MFCLYIVIIKMLLLCVLCACSVLLRQNPHNVHEWHKRVALCEGKPRDVSTVYSLLLSCI